MKRSNRLSGQPAACPAQPSAPHAASGTGAASGYEPATISVERGHREHRQIGRHQGRAERQRRPDHRRSGRGHDQLREHVLTIGPNGKIKAQVFAKSVIVLGEVTGNVTASEKVDIRDNGSVDGDIVSPRVAIAEGAHFRGSVDMQKTGSAEDRRAEPQGRAEARSEAGACTGRPPAATAGAGR